MTFERTIELDDFTDCDVGLGPEVDTPYASWLIIESARFDTIQDMCLKMNRRKTLYKSKFIGEELLKGSAGPRPWQFASPTQKHES